MPFYDPLPISTYTLSLNLAERCGWWDPAVIPEDWHEYLNCLFETGEEIGTTSVFLPTWSDATDGEGFKDAMVNRFHQVKRHAWGAEDVGYIVGQLTERPSSMRSSTMFRLGQVLHDHVLRVAMWFVLVSVYALMAYYATPALVRRGLPLRHRQQPDPAARHVHDRWSVHGHDHPLRAVALSAARWRLEVQDRA